MATITNPRSFSGLAAWRKWLQANHQKEKELWVLLAKKHVPPPKLVYPDLVDEALCWGWVDGLVNKWDADFSACRVTPRKDRSVWSAINVKKVERLLAEGRMQPAGMRLVELAKANGTWDAGVRRVTLTPPPELELALARRPKAKAFYETLTPGRRRMALEWVDHAVKAETKLRRIDELVAACERGERLF